MTKHNKIKNTAILFELLSRAVMHEVIGAEPKQTSLSIIKRHFKNGSELLKELNLYQSLAIRSEHEPAELIALALKSHKGLNAKKLQQEKYELVKSIKKHYDLKTFFESRLANYKLSATISKLFDENISPIEHLDCKKMIVEHLSGKVQTDNEELEIEQQLREQDSDIRKLSFRYIVEQFNEKYKHLNERQRKLLAMYINEDVNSDGFKNYLAGEISYIVDELSKVQHDDITKIKINEAINLTQTIISAKHIKDEHLSGMLKYYELIEELEK